MIIEAKPDNVKPGMWIMRNNGYDPATIYIVKNIVWNGDMKPGNKIELLTFWDWEEREFFFDEAYILDIVEDIGLSEVSWEEVMYDMQIVTKNEVADALYVVTDRTYEEVIQEVFK